MRKRVISLLLAVVMVLSCALQILPVQTVRAVATDPAVVVDPGTSADWENIMGTDADGSRYAGRVWVDKSVYGDGDTVILDKKQNQNSNFTVDVDQDNGEYFQVVFSALGSSMSTNTTVTASRPLDVVLVLDTSTSMRENSGSKTRFQHMIEAANKLLDDLLALGDVRIGIVSFNADSETILNLAKYNNGINLSVNNYTNTNGGGVITARDDSGVQLGKDSGFTSGTNLQDGIDRGMNILANATGTQGRVPVAIVLADGRANRAVNDDWYTINSGNRQSSGDAGIMLSTLLNAAYGRTRVEKNYGTNMTVYGIGIDLSSTSNDYIFLDPGAEGSSGFNASNTDGDVRDAWNAFTTWRAGNTATLTTGNGGWWGSTTWTFDHNWPSSAGVTTTEIAANINYVDNYQDVSGAGLGDAFDNITQELATGVFNPITSTVNGATGVEQTPLIYSDNIGKYMQVKRVQAVQVFGQTYNVTENNGSYTVAAGSGVNPTTDERFNTANDIRINVIENADGTQQLRVYIHQQILPILLDKIDATTENDETTYTMDVTEYPPLRVFYTLGIDEDVLLPNGQVDITKIDSDYAHINGDGTVSFYANAFNKMNSEDRDGDGLVELGDAHVGFVPSHNNRFYYHQAHQEIFISATNKDGSPIQWDQGEYGVLWNPDKYVLKAMTYADYDQMKDSDQVYTYITFTRPTGSGNAAEQVTYLIYATWGDLKNTVTFHDKVNNANLNGGAAIEENSVGNVVSDYKAGKNIQNTDLIAIVGLQSQRVSRLHNMFRYKDSNDTNSAELSYAPAYNKGAHDDNDIHEHSEVIVWLGNNGKLTLPVGTGLMVTKEVTEVAEGASATEEFAISVLLDMDYSADAVEGLTVVDGEGNAIADYTAQNSGGDILVTVNLADGESAYILGLPGDVSYTVTEADQEQYTYTYTGDTKTVAGVITEGVVTNDPIRPGSLYITKEVEHAHEGESFPADYEFAFRVTFLDKDGNPIKNTEFKLENNHEPSLTALTTDENGVMEGKLHHGETVHILGIPAGATVTVEEVDLPADGNYTLKSYRSRNHSGAEADNDGTVTIDPGQNATVVVTNTYTPKATSASLDLTIQKILRVDTRPSEGMYFDFALEKWDGSDWDAVKTVDELGFAASEIKTDGDNVATRDVDTAALGTFTEAGTYIYQIYEIIPQDKVSGMTYDRTIYTITVTVTDVDGQLVATAVDQNGNPVEDADQDGNLEFKASFVNEAHAATVSIDIEKRVDDTSKDPLTSKAGFVFVAQTAQVDDEGNWSVKPESEGGRSFRVYSDGVGEARLTDIYKAEGTYRYIISEADDGKTGWDYSTVRYQVTVVVTADDTGDLTAVMTVEAVEGSDQEIATVTDGTKAKLVFENTYDPANAQVDAGLLVKKELNGRALKDGEFRFAVFEDGKASHTDTDKALLIGTNDETGKVTFTATEYGIGQGLVNEDNHKLSFTKVGDYFFDVVELTGDLGGVVYDGIIYDLVVEVTGNGDGTLSCNHYFEDAVETTVTFKNTYSVKGTEVVIDGIKSLNVLSGSKALREGDYTFGLYDADGNEIDEASNLANGTFKFDTIAYTGDDIGKTFTYTVKEDRAGTTVEGVTYSSQTFTVTVKVLDNGDGTLKTEVTGNGKDNIHFVNQYASKPADVSLDGKKNLENRDLTEGEFNFALYQTDKNFENPVLKDDTITHNADGDFTVSIQDLDMGTYYYILKEVIPAQREPGIHYSGAQFNITVEVTDHGNGQMTTTKTVVNPGDDNGGDQIVFSNLYRPDSEQISLSGTKTYLGGKTLEDDVFSVGLYDSQGEQIQSAFVKADGSFTFEPLTYSYDDVGNTFTYTVKEEIPAGAAENADGTFTSGSNIYDGTVYTVTVTVVDAGGVLEITKTVNGVADGAMSFTNTYVPDAIDYVITAKKTYEKGLEGNDFQFRLESADDKTDVDETVKNDAEGIVEFSPVTLPAAGRYKFTVTEKKDGILSFIRPSEAEYEVTLVVENANGVLAVTDKIVVNTKNTGESDLEFVNTYVIDGQDEVTISGTKVLTGDRTTIGENEFAVGLYAADGTLVESKAVAADGSFSFSKLTFDETDVPVNGSKEYTYSVKEIAGNDPCIDYDDTVFAVVITVEDNDEGGVTASYTVNGGDEDIIFTNTYNHPDPITHTITAEKTYEKGLKGEDFQFKLTSLDGKTNVDETVKNDAEGLVEFTPITFTDPGEYKFKVVEKTDSIFSFILPSQAEYEVTVTVIINGQGQLEVSNVAVVNTKNTGESDLEFVNTYVIDGQDDITLSGTKKLTGDRDTVEAEEFWFGLYDAAGTEIEKVPVKADGSFRFTALHYDETDVPVNGAKEYTYTIKEIAGTDPLITYDDRVFTVVVTVKDNDEGGVTASYTVNGGDEDIIFTNTYTAPDPVEVNVEILKTVTNKTTEGIGPEGFTFVLKQGDNQVATDVSDTEGKAGFLFTLDIGDVGNTYEYKVYEQKGSKKGVTYDKTVYDLKITVEQNADGSLKTIVNDVETDTVTFTFKNTYKKPGVPDTGDEAKLLLLGLLAVVGVTGLCATVMLGFRKKERR